MGVVGKSLRESGSMMGCVVGVIESGGQVRREVCGRVGGIQCLDQRRWLFQFGWLGNGTFIQLYIQEYSETSLLYYIMI